MKKLWIFTLILLLLIFVGHLAVLTSDSSIESPVLALEVPVEEDGLTDAKVVAEDTTEPPDECSPDSVEQAQEEPLGSSEPPISEEIAIPDTTPEPVQTPHPKPIQLEDAVIRQDGAIYVPGFGWIPDSGEENVCIIAPHAGTGEIVGEM